MSSDSILNPQMWRDYWHLHKTALNGKRTLRHALKWLDDNYTGDTRKAHCHQGYCHPGDIYTESTFRMWLKDAIKLGYGNDYNFERAFR